jgi:hypothetical protein
MKKCFIDNEGKTRAENMVRSGALLLDWDELPVLWDKARSAPEFTPEPAAFLRKSEHLIQEISG